MLFILNVLPMLSQTVSPMELPMIYLQAVAQDGIQKGMRGLDLMNGNEVFVVEKQTWGYYAYYHNNFVVDDDVFGFENIVTVTNRDLTAGTVVMSSFSTRMRYFTTNLGTDC